MKIIKCLSESIEQELEDAEEYAKLAIKYKEDYPAAAATFYKLSSSRMDGISDLHNEVTALIKDYRSKEGEPPAPMMAIYNYMHEREMNKAVAVKKLQEMYKTGTI